MKNKLRGHKWKTLGREKGSIYTAAVRSVFNLARDLEKIKEYSQSHMTFYTKRRSSGGRTRCPNASAGCLSSDRVARPPMFLRLSVFALQVYQQSQSVRRAPQHCYSVVDDLDVIKNLLTRP